MPGSFALNPAFSFAWLGEIRSNDKFLRILFSDQVACKNNLYIGLINNPVVISLMRRLYLMLTSLFVSYKYNGALPFSLQHLPYKMTGPYRQA